MSLGHLWSNHDVKTTHTTQAWCFQCLHAVACLQMLRYYLNFFHKNRSHSHNFSMTTSFFNIFALFFPVRPEYVLKKTGRMPQFVPSHLMAVLARRPPRPGLLAWQGDRIQPVEVMTAKSKVRNLKRPQHETRDISIFLHRCSVNKDRKNLKLKLIFQVLKSKSDLQVVEFSSLAEVQRFVPPKRAKGVLLAVPGPGGQCYRGGRAHGQGTTVRHVKQRGTKLPEDPIYDNPCRLLGLYYIILHGIFTNMLTNF